MRGIDSVTYHLHPTFSPKDIEVKEKEGESTNFALVGKGWGEFTIGLEIFVKGKKTIVSHRLASFFRGGTNGEKTIQTRLRQCW